MKLTALLLFAACLQVAARTNGQTVSLSVKNVPLKQILISIQDQTGFSVLFDSRLIENAHPVTVNVKDMPVAEAMKLCLKGQPFQFLLGSNSIVVKAAAAGDLHPQASILFIPPITVRGRIVNEKGEPVIASVLIKGGRQGTTTDVDGNFSLNDVPDSATLIVSGVSIETEEIQINKRTSITVRASTKVNAEEEVVIRTDYFGSAKRKSTMNISKVDGKEIENQPVTSLLNALVGRVPGLDIDPVSGAAGAAPGIQIRGRNSLSQTGSYPLYVIDGVQLESQPLRTFTTGNYFEGIDPLSTFSPADIESIEVLKDAAATAIYGSRGANGVIRITTKKAKSYRDPGLNLNFYRGFGGIPKKVDLLNKDQYMTMRREAYANDNLVPDEYTPDLAGIWDTTRTTDWQKELIGGTANISDVQLSYFGGNNGNSFRIGGGYHKETNIFPGDDFSFQRANGSFSFNHVSNRVDLSANVNIGWVNNKSYADIDYINLALTLPPVAPKLYNEDGTINWEYYPDALAPGIETWANPIANLLNTDDMQTNSLAGNLNVGYQILPGLKLRTIFSISKLINKQDSKYPVAGVRPSFRVGSTGIAYFTKNDRSSFMVDPQLAYNKRVSNHQFNALVGGTFQYSTNNSNTAIGTGYINDAMMGTIKAARSITYPFDNQFVYKYASLYTHIGYTYKDRVLIDLTARRDGSSKFGPGKRFANFGAIGAGWIFKDQNANNQTNRFFSFGKIRSSYGLTGNDQIGDYQYLDVYSILTVGYQNSISLNPSSLFNPDYRWESTRKLEVAGEFGFFNNKLMMEVAWYKNRTFNQLIYGIVPAITGFPSVLQNFGAIVQNAGMEISISSTNIDRPKFKWTWSFNISVPRNKLVKFDGIESSAYSTQYRVGYPLNIQPTLRYLGVDPVTGLHTVADKNGDGFIDDSDFELSKSIGKNNYYGLINSFKFKNLELSFLIQGAANYLDQYMSLQMPGSINNQPVKVLNRWQKSGDKTDIQRYSISNLSEYSYAASSDRSVGKALFVRLKTLSLSYQLSNLKSFRKFRIKDAKVYLQGQNLLTVTGYGGLDPETGNGMPPLRILTAGLQFTL